MEIRIKQGVDISRLQNAITSILWPVAAIFFRYGYDCVITSARRRPVGEFSFHHTGLALDFRAKHIHTPGNKERILTELRAALGADYDIILYGEGDNIHYHIEYDPK